MENMNQSTDITGNFGILYHPKSALVFYQADKSTSDMYVESFDMDKNGNLANAHPLSVREANRLSKMLKVRSNEERSFLKPQTILSSNILYIDSSEKGRVVWFTKAQQKELFFVENLEIPNGKANVPPLLWIADKQGLKIFALLSDERPDEATNVFYAPFFNVYQNGNVCMGSVDVKIKNSASLEEFIENWENCFFNSYFSHLMLNHNPVKGNCVNLWKKLIESNEPFPINVLVDANLNLKNVLQ